jgi:putative flippase GtrA
LIVFAGSGALNTLLSWLVYVALLRFGLDVPAAFSISFVAGVGLSALLNLKLVFGVRHSVGNASRYALAYVVMYAVGLGLVALLVRLGASPPWAPLLALPVTVPLSFLVIQWTLAHRR